MCGEKKNMYILMYVPLSGDDRVIVFIFKIRTYSSENTLFCIFDVTHVDDLREMVR